MLPAYAELHCLTNFTFLRGASAPEELVERAHELGYSALAITDECSVAGAVRAHVAAKRCGLKLLIGTEIQLADGLKLVLLATSREGYGHLCALITRGRTQTEKGSYRLERSDLEQGLAGCLAILIPPAFPATNLPILTAQSAVTPPPLQRGEPAQRARGRPEGGDGSLLRKGDRG